MNYGSGCDRPKGLREFRQRGHSRGLRNILTQNIRARPGSQSTLGDFVSHEQVGSFFRRTMELSRGAFSIDLHNVLAQSDLVVALMTVNERRNEVSASFLEGARLANEKR